MRSAALALLALATPLLARAAGEAPARGYLPCRQRSAPVAAAVARAPGPGPSARELDELEAAQERFDAEGRAYRAEMQQQVRQKFEERRRAIVERHEQSIAELEGQERAERDQAIARFEAFLARYPDDPRFTPDAMLRLAELDYEQANDEFRAATERYREEARRRLAEGGEPPPEPMKNYAPSIALYQRLLTGFPDYGYTHGVQYLLAWCLGEMGQGPEALAAYRALIERFPDSPFVPEAWVRLGDWYFDQAGDRSLRQAADAYGRLRAWPGSPLYPRALYKLGWTWYRLDDFAGAVDAFGRLLDHDVEQARRPGQPPHGETWPEAVQYMAVSFADERWGGVERARAWFARRGPRPWEAEVFTRLGDVYFEQTRYAAAVDAWRVVLALEPLAPGAPRLQERIVLAWSRDRRFDREAEARQALVDAYSPGTPWWTRHRGDADLLAAARDLVEQSLLRVATWRHAQAQRQKAEGKPAEAAERYRLAASSYGEYLARFPHSRQAHRLTYDWADCLYQAGDYVAAARAYAAVRDDPADDALWGEAALSAVLSWQGEVARQERDGRLPLRPVRRSPERAGREEVRPLPLPPLLQDLVRDSDVYLSRAVGAEPAATIAYKAGETFYAWDDLDEARCRFEEVVDRWPRAEVARYAANLIIESWLATRDWQAVEEAATRLQASPVAQDPALRASLQRFKLGARFNRAMALMEARDYEPAARLFVALVEEDPGHEFADKALYDAASCYEGARRYESALRLYQRVSDEYPRSPLADDALFRVGFNAENTWDFEKAVGRYLLLVEKYPKSVHRKDALYNAARAEENLQRYDAAAAAFARYARTWPEAEDAAAAQFHAAVLLERLRDWKREVAALQDLDQRFGRSAPAELLVQARLKQGLAWRELKDDRAARAAFAAAVAEYDRRGLTPEGAPAAAAAAAEARFRLAEFEFERYDAITLPATTDTRRLEKALAAKLAEARRVAPLYDEVAQYKRPDWILAAFYRKANLLERLAQTIQDAPVPPEYLRPGQEEFLAAYQDGLAGFAQPYEDQAVAIQVQAIEAARRLHVKNEWTRKIAESLARYRPSEYPILKEAKSRMITEDLSAVALAGPPEGPTGRPAATLMESAATITPNPPAVPTNTTTASPAATGSRPGAGPAK